MSMELSAKAFIYRAELVSAAKKIRNIIFL